MPYSMTPGEGLDEEDDDFDENLLERVQQLAEGNPIPDDLREQIGNWIEPQTVHAEADHADVMDAIEIAYPLIIAWHAERQEATAR